MVVSLSQVAIFGDGRGCQHLWTMISLSQLKTAEPGLCHCNSSGDNNTNNNHGDEEDDDDDENQNRHVISNNGHLLPLFCLCKSAHRSAAPKNND